MAEAGTAGVLATMLLLVPHTLPLRRVNPAAAGAVWFAALVLRALLVLALALAALLVLPATAWFDRVAGWSVHGLGSLHLDLSGEAVAHVAVLAPPVLTALSVLGFAAGVLRGGVALERELSRRSLGSGPGGSLVIADRALLVAVPGLGRRRIVLSDRALAELDAAELEACLAHESGHLSRCHRALGLAGDCLATLARPVPGARKARSGLLLSLERDADEYAVARTGNPLALASAICKVAGARRGLDGLAAFGLDGAATSARLDCLLADGRRRGSAPLEGLVLAAAVLLFAVAAAGAAALVLWLGDSAPRAALAAALSCG
ncbi:MAG: M48 family metalloprotease [Thermoleophilaceae bacterium]